MLSFIYQPPLTGNPDPRLLLSLSTAASVYVRQGRLLPILATRGAGNTPKVSLADMTHMKSDTITMNTEHARNMISAVSSALTASNKGEEISEGREGREQQRGEERNSECILGEICGQVSPRVQDPVVFNRATVCVMRDISALCSGAHKPWASLNWWHRHSHICKTHSPIPTVSRSAPYPAGRSVYKCPALSPPLPAPIGIVKTVQHPYGIGSANPVIQTPIAHLFVALPIYCTPLVPKCVA